MTKCYNRIFSTPFFFLIIFKFRKYNGLCAIDFREADLLEQIKINTLYFRNHMNIRASLAKPYCLFIP